MITRNTPVVCLYAVFIIFSTLTFSTRCIEVPEINCKAKDEHEPAEKIEIEEFLRMQDEHHTYLLIEEYDNVKVYHFEENPSKVLFAKKIQRSEEETIVFGTRVAKFFGHPDMTKRYNIKVSPEVFQMYCVRENDNESKVMYVAERYRGNLDTGVNDPRFFKYMSTFVNRIDFYAQLVKAFKVIDIKNGKHCDVRPESFLYKESGDEWLQNYKKGNTPLTFIPGITNFDKLVDVKKSCVNPKPDYCEPEEYGGNVNFTYEYVENVELFSISLVILKLEARILSKQIDSIIYDQALKDALKALPDASEILNRNLGTADHPLQSKKLSEIFAGLISIVERWNKKVEVYNNSDFKKDVEYLAKGMRAHYEFILNNKQAEQSKINSLLSIYDKFTDYLAMMVRQNDMFTVWQRPSTASVLSNFLSQSSRS